jgi:hypothetical protein
LFIFSPPSATNNFLINLLKTGHRTLNHPLEIEFTFLDK